MIQYYVKIFNSGRPNVVMIKEEKQTLFDRQVHIIFLNVVLS